MKDFDLKKYLREGKLYEENQSPKFKKDDKVRFNDPKYKQWSGRILSIEEPTPEGEPTYKVHMDSGRLAKYSFGSLGTFKESELSPFRVTPKEESGKIDHVYGYHKDDSILIFADGKIIKGEKTFTSKPSKAFPEYNTYYNYFDFSNDGNPAIEWLKSNIPFKEIEGKVRFSQSTFEKFMKKQGIMYYPNLYNSNKEEDIKKYLEDNK